MARRPRLFANVKKWRATNKHTGIDKFAGVPYTYEHVARPPHAGAEVYRIETYIPLVQPRPIHRDVYYVPARQLDSFFDGWEEHATTVVDIRPLTMADALAEIRAFRIAAEKDGRS